MIVYVQSITDVVTNSSSEIFTVYSEASMEQVKEVVNAILKLGTSGNTFDDLFECELIVDPDAKEEYNQYVRTAKGPVESLQEFVRNHDSCCIDYQEGYLYNWGYKIYPKKSDPDVSKAAELLSKLDAIFEKVTLYN